MKFCITCGMPLEGEHEKDFGMDLPEGPVCQFDIKDGKLKSPEEIFEGGVTFFAGACADGDRGLGARLTVKNMKQLAYWQTRPFDLLNGPEATDEEYAAAVAKL
jgi:hypothetical protein